MTERVAIVDFGAGNLHSVAHALKAVGAEPSLVTSSEELRSFDRAVLPGVGEFGSCMRQLKQRGLREGLCEHMQKRPLLGVCVGMQLLAERSEESPGVDAFALVPGVFRKFQAGGLESDGRRRKVPHMGWTPVVQSSHPCWQGICNQSRFYFVHSYYLPSSLRSDLAGVADHGVEFAAALATDNVFATQFHPEKSGPDGLRLYANFVGWKP